MLKALLMPLGCLGYILWGIICLAIWGAPIFILILTFEFDFWVTILMVALFKIPFLGVWVRLAAYCVCIWLMMDYDIRLALNIFFWVSFAFFFISEIVPMAIFIFSRGKINPYEERARLYREKTGFYP
jgi:hypothetical protein